MKGAGAATVAAALAAAVRAGADPAAAVEASLCRAQDDPHRAFVHVDPAHVTRQLAALHACRVGEGGRAGALAGVPVALKDNLADAGQPLEAASRILHGHRAGYSATVVERLRAAGAVVIGRTNMDEFAMGSSTEHSIHGPTTNPHDRARTPGGSSGGSAAAVAAGVVPLALGSDTGGSVRQPAAFCGVVGLKPTYGRVSRRGLVAFASTLDVVGVFGAGVRDAALLAGVVAGGDPGDVRTVEQPVPDWVSACARGVSGLRIGLLAGEGVDAGVAARVREASEVLRAAGATVRPLDPTVGEEALACYQVLAAAEAASNLARYDGVRFGPRADAGDLATFYADTRGAGFGAEVRRRVLFGTWLLSDGRALLGRAQAARHQISAAFAATFAEVDLLLGPTTPTVAFPLGARTRDPIAMYRADLLTVPASLAGLPALSVPFGQDGGLPVGVQLVARPWDEASLFAAAAVLERAVEGAPG